MFLDNHVEMPSSVKKTATIYLIIDFILELAIGFYLAIDFKVLDLHTESVFYYLGILIFINIFCEIGMFIRGYSERNWFLICRIRAFAFLLSFIIFITSAPGIISDKKVYIDVGFGIFFIVSIVYNLIAIWAT